MAENKNKTVLLGIAAATAVVGIALLMKYVWNDDDEENKEGSASSLQDDLEEAKLNVVKKSPNGQQLDPMYCVQLLNFVTQSSRKRRSEQRKQALEQRRQFYKDNLWDDYKENVRDQFMADDQMCQVVMREVLEILTDTDEMMFQNTMNTLARDHRMSQMLMAAQQGKLPSEDQMKVPAGSAEPKLQKSKTLTAFAESKKLTMEAMKKSQTQRPGGDEMEMMIDMFVDQAKVEDALFINQGVSSEELEESIMYWMQKEDPEVKKAMMAYMMEMQMEMQKMQVGGGMGGFPGM